MTTNWYIGVSAAEHASRTAELLAEGLRLVSLGSYGTPAAPAYSAVWADVDGPPWVAFDGLSLAAYSTALLFNAARRLAAGAAHCGGRHGRQRPLRRNINGGHGFDGVSNLTGGGFHADKGGSLETSGNAVWLSTGGLGYVMCWGMQPTERQWYPFNSVLAAADAHDWGTTDLFPQYGMAAF